MEFIGTAQQILQILTPQPTGRPRSASSAIRRSIIVGAIGLRNICRPLKITPLAARAGALTISLALARSLLENNNLTSDHIGRIPFIVLQLLYTLAFLTLSSPLWRKVRPLF